MLASERKVLVSTNSQALNALLVTCRKVLDSYPLWLQNINRSTQLNRIPALHHLLEDGESTRANSQVGGASFTPI